MVIGSTTAKKNLLETLGGHLPASWTVQLLQLIPAESLDSRLGIAIAWLAFVPTDSVLTAAARCPLNGDVLLPSLAIAGECHVRH
jgi:hypothetical protein